MRKSPAKVLSKAHVLHPINTDGTTWLRESDLVFINKEPYAVLSWHGDHKDVPDQFIPLNPKQLRHDHGDPSHYRYEGEIIDPATAQRINKLS
jgi:hypothetical protein